MKIKITFAIDIDPEACASNYGIHPNNKAEIRRDVQGCFENQCWEQLIRIGCEAKREDEQL